jgi:glutamate synthase (NADPH/NADH) large chain
VRREPAPSLDETVLADAAPVFDRHEKMHLDYTVQNTHRAIGARVSSHIIKEFGPDGLRPGHLRVRLSGAAGQSLGAFGARGLRLELVGEANDYVGKGLSGAEIVLRPPPRAGYVARHSAILGNTALYGATSGTLFAAGRAGERFGVRNSGAETVIEGCGDNGCEYMTGGTAVILGSVGDNFAAGMTGGLAFVYAPDIDALRPRVNAGTVDVLEAVPEGSMQAILERLVRAHAEATQSEWAGELLNTWEESLNSIRVIAPPHIIKEMTAAGPNALISQPA